LLFSYFWLLTNFYCSAIYYRLHFCKGSYCTQETFSHNPTKFHWCTMTRAGWSFGAKKVHTWKNHLFEKMTVLYKCFVQLLSARWYVTERTVSKFIWSSKVTGTSKKQSLLENSRRDWLLGFFFVSFIHNDASQFCGFFTFHFFKIFSRLDRFWRSERPISPLSAHIASSHKSTYNSKYNLTRPGFKPTTVRPLFLLQCIFLPSLSCKKF